jgi:hypothetical protein
MAQRKINKVFETQDEALKHAVALLKRPGRGWFYSGSDDLTEDAKKILKIVLGSIGKEGKYIIELTKKLGIENSNYTIQNSKIEIVLDSSTKRDEDFSPMASRMLFNIKGEYFSLFDMVGMKSEDIVELSDIYKNVSDIIKLAYVHFCKNKEYDNAIKLLEMLKGPNSVYDNVTLRVVSDLSYEHIPLLKFYDNKKQIDKEMVNAYIVSLYSNNKYIPEDLDKPFHEYILNKYKKFFKKVQFSQYLEEDENIDYFDVLESDLSARERLLKVSDYQSASILRKLAEKDPKRLETLIVKHLNNNHENGKRKAGFLSTYKKLLGAFKNTDFEIDVFQLSPKLQSYVLLQTLGGD